MRLRLLRGRSSWLGRGSHRKTRRIRKTAGMASAIAPDQSPAGGLGAAQSQQQTQAYPWTTRPSQAARPANAVKPGGLGLAVAPGSARGAARAAIRVAPDPTGIAAHAAAVSNATTSGSTAAARAAVTTEEARPWYAVARPGPLAQAAGRRNCGCLEQVLIREWAEGDEPPAQIVAAIDRLAALPLIIKEKLTVGLDAIHVGRGGVPDLDDMGELAGVPLPSGRATWDACAGAYGNRKIVVGSRPSPTPDVMCHEVGHALDDIDGPSGQWQSDSADFRALYTRCLSHIASEFHRHGQSLGRREFFADAFAAIASSQRPALVEMLSGDTRTALDVMLYFNVRYGL
jgi:hypothetical protein